MAKLISISLSPNTEKDDINLALKLIFKKISKSKELEEEIRKYFGVKYVYLLNSGRSALMVLFSSLGLQSGDEILLQAFTCNAVPNPVIWSGLRPVFVDCNEDDFNINCEDLKRKITQKSKAVIIQHTFGLPANIDEISRICQENNLILIEDCAHSLGASYNEKKVGSPAKAQMAKVGTFGKAAIFSMSRDKIISSVYGGFIITNDDVLGGKIKEFYSKIDYPSWFWTHQQLLHPILMNWVIMPTYNSFGKYLLVFFQQLHILSKAVHWKEKRGMRPDYFPKKLPPTLAVLALNQFKKLERFNNHRKEIAKIYFDSLNSTFQLPKIFPERENIYLRFTIKKNNAHKIIKKARKKNLLLGDWYDSPIAPKDTKLEVIGYKLGSCPIAEKLSSETLNLPTHININKEDAKNIVEFLNNSPI